MGHGHNEQFDVAWILSSPDHHVIAASFFDEIYDDHLPSKSFNAIYSTGRVGQHTVVIASKNPTVSQSAEDMVDSLLQEFPSVRAGFLMSAGAVASKKGHARLGDVVFGTKPDLQSGVIYFDAEETIKLERLSINGQGKHIPEAATAALESTLGQHRFDFQSQKLGEHYPRSYRTLRGAIASSTQHLDDPLILDGIASNNDILCFETTAASMEAHSFILISSITRYSDDHQDRLSPADVCKVLASHLSRLTRLMDPVKLRMEPPLARYFKYEPFDLDRLGFRLVRLEAGPSHDLIRCHLFQAYLDDEESLIPYEALSYCWGSNSSQQHRVLVDGRSLFVTENLFDALKDLRQEAEDRVLWVDALCIDQSNILERGHQVTWMGKVYENAERVLFWLGHVSYQYEGLIQLLKAFKRKAPHTAWHEWPVEDPRWLDVWTRVRTEFFENPGEDEQPLHLKEASQSSYLRLLMENEWFSRVWILQEVAYAKKALLGCSEGWVDAMAFAMAPKLLGVEPNTQCQAVIDIMPGPSRRTSWWAQKSNICTLLWKFRESKAGDPRDRLYALLGLASDMNDGDERITADYTKTEDAIVKDIATYLFNNRIQPLEIESLADLQERIPDLSDITLERMCSLGSQLDEVQNFIQKQNQATWLWEVGTLDCWFTESDYMQYFRSNHFLDQKVTRESPCAASPASQTTLDLFLKRNSVKINATDRTMNGLALRGIDTVEQVLQHGLQEVEITEAFAVAAVLKGPSSLQLLLARADAKFKVTEKLVRIAIQEGPETLQILLHQRGNQIELTAALIEASARAGSASFQLLLHHQLFVAKTINTTTMNALAKAAAGIGPDVLQLILDKYGNGVKIFHSLVVSAIDGGYDTFRVLMDTRGEEVWIDPLIIEAAIKNGPRTLGLLLDRLGKEVKVTTDVMLVAVWYKPQTLTMLLRCRFGVNYVRGILRELIDGCRKLV